jgi:hypothetical protein
VDTTINLANNRPFKVNLAVDIRDCWRVGHVNVVIAEGQRFVVSAEATSRKAREVAHPPHPGLFTRQKNW